jgi:hypothetical protein
MVQNAEIRGSGIAAEACCAILRRFGWSVNTPEHGKVAIPYLVLNSITAALVKDVFGVEQLDGHQISRRLIVNHLKKTISDVTEPAIVLNGETLNFLRATGASSRFPRGDVLWRLFAGEPAPNGQLTTFGNRTAWIFDAELHNGFDADVTILELIPDGWLFFAPVSEKKGILQLISSRLHVNATAACRAALMRTRIVKEVSEVTKCIAGPIPCAPALHNQLSGPEWIATGTSALRYDPISGDGTGVSLRSAILACATLRAIHQYACPERYLRYYRERLRETFRQHLSICKSLYEAAGSFSAWNEEIGYCPPGNEEFLKTIGQVNVQLCNYMLAPRAS